MLKQIDIQKGWVDVDYTLQLNIAALRVKQSNWRHKLSRIEYIMMTDNIRVPLLHFIWRKNQISFAGSNTMQYQFIYIPIGLSGPSCKCDTKRGVTSDVAEVMAIVTLPMNEISQQTFPFSIFWISYLFLTRSCTIFWSLFLSRSCHF